MIHSRITGKAQTTIPKAVREALNLREGDEVSYEIAGDRVVLSKIEQSDGFLANFSTFTEWSSDADRVYDVLAVPSHDGHLGE